MLVKNDVDKITYFALGGDFESAAKLLVEKTGCNIDDANNFVDDLASGGDFEELLSKHWIEDYSSVVVNNQKIPFTKQEKRAMFKMFVPVGLTFVILIVLLILF